ATEPRESSRFRLPADDSPGRRSAYAAGLLPYYSGYGPDICRWDRPRGCAGGAPVRLLSWSRNLPQNTSSVWETRPPRRRTSLSGQPGRRSSTPEYAPGSPWSGTDLPYSATA